MNGNYESTGILQEKWCVELLGLGIYFAKLILLVSNKKFFEEFCHSPVFGIKKSHQVWILGQGEKPLSQKLGRVGFKLSYIELNNQDLLSQLFESIFFVQNLMLLLAEKYGYTDLNYLVMKDVLKASSDIIYSE